MLLHFNHTLQAQKILPAKICAFKVFFNTVIFLTRFDNFTDKS